MGKTASHSGSRSFGNVTVGGASLTHGYLMAAFQAARTDAVYLITLNRAFGILVCARSGNEKRMIKINFQTPRTAQWRQWRKDCNAALKAMKRQKKPPYVFSPELYKGCRELILAASHEKCAYCEGPLLAQSFIDVEHFRPKGGVRDLKNKVVRAGKDPHPGYWWLAYDPSNLLPSCSMCNKYNQKYGGKGERFPLRENEFRARKPGEEKREKCLLIHPGQDKDPSAHFDIVRETGYLKALDDRGTATIEVMGLNREALMKGRREAGRDATLYLAVGEKFGKEYKDRIASQLEGRLPYSFVWIRLNQQMKKKSKAKRTPLSNVRKRS